MQIYFTVETRNEKTLRFNEISTQFGRKGHRSKNSNVFETILIPKLIQFLIL